MFLTKEEEKMLSGEYGEAVALAMKVIVKVGESLGAEKLVKVRHVHVSGVSYSNIGDPGLSFIEKLLRYRVKASVYTTSNPTCIDLSGSTRLFNKTLVSGQLRINRVLEAMNVKPFYTCIPYLLRKPGFGEHLAWGESNAVVIANSIYGARTNREGGPLTLFAALTGRTSYSGLHVYENRVAQVLVEYKGSGKLDDYWGSLLGLFIGDMVEEIPLVKGVDTSDFSVLKEFLAATAASGSHGLVVLDKITPPKSYDTDIEDKLVVNTSDLRKYLYETASDFDENRSILVYVGCPHLSLTELAKLSTLVSRYRRLKKNIRFLITIPYAYRKLVDEYALVLRSRGVDVAYGTCPIVSKLDEKPDLVVTNSGKALFYLKKLHRLNVSLMSLDNIVKKVFT